MQNHLTAAALAALLLAAPALAAPAPAAAPSASPTPSASVADKLEFGGPAIPGVCLLSRDQVFSRSLVGQAAIARLKQLGQQAQASYDAQRRKLEAEAKALQSQGPTLPPAQAQRRRQQLEARAEAIQTEAAQAQRELEATRAKAMAQIDDAFRPIVLDAYKAKGCGLLLSREAVVGANLANDLTPDVLKGLDAKMTTITFEREHLPPGGSGGG